MTAVTSQDVQQLFAGSDAAEDVQLADGCVIKGVFRYRYQDALDYNTRLPSVVAATADVASVAAGQSMIVDSVTYTVRAVEVSEYRTTVFLEVT